MFSCTFIIIHIQRHLSMIFIVSETFWRQYERDRLTADKGLSSGATASSSKTSETNDDNDDIEGESSTEDDDYDCGLLDNDNS